MIHSDVAWAASLKKCALAAPYCDTVRVTVYWPFQANNRVRVTSAVSRYESLMHLTRV
jgi:hypothetical protein